MSDLNKTLDNLELVIGELCDRVNSGIDNEDLDLGSYAIKMLTAQFTDLQERIEEEYPDQATEEDIAKLRNINLKFREMILNTKAYYGV